LRAPPAGGAIERPERGKAMATCIVCNKEFETGQNDFRWHHTDGKWYSFDDIGCRNRFIGDPKRFLEGE